MSSIGCWCGAELETTLGGSDLSRFCMKFARTNIAARIKLAVPPPKNAALNAEGAFTCLDRRRAPTRLPNRPRRQSGSMSWPWRSDKLRKRGKRRVHALTDARPRARSRVQKPARRKHDDVPGSRNREFAIG